MAALSWPQSERDQDWSSPAPSGSDTPTWARPRPPPPPPGPTPPGTSFGVRVPRPLLGLLLGGFLIPLLPSGAPLGLGACGMGTRVLSHPGGGDSRVPWGVGGQLGQGWGLSPGRSSRAGFPSASGSRCGGPSSSSPFRSLSASLPSPGDGGTSGTGGCGDTEERL